MFKAIQQNNNPEVLTKIINDYIHSPQFINYVEDRVTDEELLNYLATFRITVGDELGGDFSEVVMSKDRIKYFLMREDDVLQQFLHDSLHEMAWKRWKQCPVDFSEFTEPEADVIDEMWNQAFLFKYMPWLHHLHIEYVNNCIKFVGGTPDHVEEVAALFTNFAANDNRLAVAQTWLYEQENIASQETFSKFMQLCDWALQDEDTSKLIERYNRNMNGKEL